MPTRSQALLPSLFAGLLFSLASAHAQSNPPVTLPAIQGQPVTAVRIVDEKGAVLQENPTDLPLKPGQPFSADTERDSLRQIFRTGQYADVSVQAEQVSGGLRVDFVVQSNYYVNQVTVTGLREPPTEEVAVATLQLAFGAVFRESDVPPAIARLQQTLQDDGLYQAKISYALSPHEDSRQMDIAVTVDPGPRATIGAISLKNQTPFSEKEVRGRLRLKPGKQLTAQELNNSADRVRKWLVNRNYLGARVSITRGVYDPKTANVPLDVQLSAGLQVRVVIEGAKFSSSALHRLLPIYQEGSIDEDLLQEGRRNLRDDLQKQGYFNADVTYSSSPGADGASTTGTEEAPLGGTITYSVERSARLRLAGFAFTGNRYFNDEILKGRMQIQTAGSTTRGRFSSAMLDTDVSAISGLYQANGFLQAKVTDEVLNNYRGKRDDLFVRFHIDEGLQTRVAELHIEGNRMLNSETLNAVIGSTPGQPFSDFSVAGDRDNILVLYFNQGFTEATFSASIENLADPADENPMVDLTYHISEGPQLIVSQVLISGYEHTRLGLIQSEIQLHAGQPLSEGSLVESQRRLYNLGIFSSVAIAPQNPTGSDPNKSVGVLVQEARRYTIGYGAGLEVLPVGGPGQGPASAPLQVAPRGTIEFAKLNLTGRADSLSFKVRASTLQGRGLLTYTLPNVFNNPAWSLQLSGDYDKELDVATFTSLRTEGSAQLTDRLASGTSLSFRYAYRHVLASDLQVSPQEIPLFSQPTRVSLFGGTVLRDTRDNASDANRGSLNSIDLDVAGRSLGSSSSFVRALLQHSSYTPLGKFVFVRAVRVGLMTPISATQAADIPLPERFFSGGGTTLRGFGLNEAGPRDPLTGFPIGGLGMLLVKLQLQFPMRLPYIGNRVGGAIFYDGGNVFSSFHEISLRAAPRTPVFDPTQPGLCIAYCENTMNYFSHTIGFELRYHTPIGPVSIDLAYQLNPAQFLEPNGATLPNNTPGLQLGRLPAFQFYVNLGPTF